MSEKIWFSGHGPFNDCSVYAELRTKQQVLDYFDETHDPTVAKLLKGRTFEKIRVESCWKEGEDTYVYMWGYSQPTMDMNDYGDHVGLRIELDDEVIFNDMKPTSDSVEDHDPDCEECAK